MQPVTYTFTDVLFFTKNKEITVVDQNGELSGFVKRTHKDLPLLHDDEVRKDGHFLFENPLGELVTSIAVQKDGLKSIRGYRYLLHHYASGETTELKDLNWVSYLYFHVKGHIHSINFELHEDWNGQLVLKANRTIFATITVDSITNNVTILVKQSPSPFLTDPSFLTLLYFIYRIYSMESELIEELLFE